MWTQVALSSAKACIFFRNEIRTALRRFRPYASEPANDQLAFRQGLEIIRQAKLAGGKLGRVLEIGTGWVPTIPYLFHAAGAGEIVMTDVEELIDAHTHAAAKAFVAKNIDEIADQLNLSADVARANLERPFAGLYMCPFDRSRVAARSIDVVYSRTVLEHISPPTLEHILSDGRDYLAPGGLSIHVIDNSDHFEHRDKSLSRINFLRYPDWIWRMTHLNIQSYQNRLRHSDYIRLFQQAGYDLLHVEGEAHAGCLEELKTMKLAPRFKGYTPNDLATLTSLIVARNG